jgi:hypothetical protein
MLPRFPRRGSKFEMKNALITGVNGRDGNALEEVCLDLPTALQPGRSQSAVGRRVEGGKATELETQGAIQRTGSYDGGFRCQK